MGISNEEKGNSMRYDTNVNSGVDTVIPKTCEKCSGSLEVKKVGFLSQGK